MDMTNGSTDVASLRHCVCDQGLLNRTDGSARLMQGKTSVLVGVYGPGEVRVSKELANRATIEVIFKPKVGMPGVKHRALEQLIRSTCEASVLTALHPRSVISITVQEEHDDGSLVACTLNAVCMALMDTGISMNYPTAAVKTALMPDDVIVFDPTSEQEETAKATLLTVFDNTSKGIVSCQSTGLFTVDELERCTSASETAAASIQQFYRAAMGRKLQKEAKYRSLMQGSSK